MYLFRRRKELADNMNNSMNNSISGSSGMRLLARYVICFAVLGLLWVGYVQWNIHAAEQYSYTSDVYDTGIVLGAALWNDKPSPALAERLHLAARLYEDGRVASLIVSGGIGSGSTISEAEGMRRYLVSRGVPEEAIRLEPEAANTYENLKFSKRIMDAEGWQSAMLITHTYHGARAGDIARFLGYKQPFPALTDSQVMSMAWHKSRETLAYTKWIADKWALQLGLSG